MAIPKRFVPYLAIIFAAPLKSHATANNAVLDETLTNEFLEKISMHKDEFNSWMKEFDKAYDSVEEETRRLITWVRNHEHIQRHNSQEPQSSYTLGHNHFSDLTNKEFRELNFLGEFSPDNVEGYDDVRGIVEPPSDDASVARKLGNLASHVDWVDAGAVTSPVNQGDCGGCWAITTAGSIEGARFLKTGKLEKLSPQMIIDCDHKDHACKGGVYMSAYKFDAVEGGLCSEKSYPYVGKRHKKCKAKHCKRVQDTKVKSFKAVKEADVGAMKVALSSQPVAAAMHGTGLNFQLYKSGVYNNYDCDTKLDHGVLAVGYGTDSKSGLDYFKIRNSWGPYWGENGYFRINTEVRPKTHGICGILSKLSMFPIIA